MAASPKKLGTPYTAAKLLAGEPALRATREGDISQRSPARDLQHTLTDSIAHPAHSGQPLSVPKRIAVIGSLASLSWALVGGVVYVATR